MRITVDSNKIRLYDSYLYKDKIKLVSGFRFDKNEKCWEAKFEPARLMELTEVIGDVMLDCDDNTRAYIKQVKKLEEDRLNKIATLADIRDNKRIDLTGYDIPTGVTLYDHQKIALTFLKNTTVCNLFADCGVGKTLVALLWLSYLKKQKPGFKALVVAPLRTLVPAWEGDIRKFVPSLTYTVMNKGGKANKALLSESSDIYLTNFESVRTLKDDMIKACFDCVIVDESSKMKSPKTATTQALINIADSGVPYKMVMSGTPAPNGPLEYFPQIRFISKRLFGLDYFRFRNRYFIASGFGGFNYVFDESKSDVFTKKLYTYGLRYKDSDCLDLPPEIYQNCNVVLPKPVLQAYTQYRDLSFLEIEKEGQDKEVFASFTPLDRLLKLREYTSGFLMKTDPDGDRVIETIHNEKLLALKDMLEEIGPQQGIIWGQFRHELEVIHKSLPNSCLVYGGTKNADQLVKDFQEGKYQYLVANPASLGHGISFTNCRVNIWYSLSYSSELYHQANKRTMRIGQTGPVKYYHILACGLKGEETIDQLLLDVVQNKLDKQAEFVDSIRNQGYEVDDKENAS